ncbi:MAG: TIR domain-containing protein [Candidatus Hodarchaeota archaeon]
MRKRKFNVFLSHNNADKPAIEALARKLVKEGINPWLDKWNVIPGEPWHEAIIEALDRCETCAVLIGPSGIGPWQNEEMRAAIERRVKGSKGRFRVIPVLLPGSKRDERSRLPTFLVATTWVEFRNTIDDEEAFYHLVCGIKGLEPGPESSKAFYEGTCPYLGLKFFNVEQAKFFFGREALTGWLLNELRPSLNSLKDNRFLGIIGPSGSGKSSLARAGLLAALKQGNIEGSENWSIVICRPGADPLENIAIALSPILGNLKTPSQICSLLKDLRNDERTLHLTIRLAQRKKPPEWRLTILIDQFEEVFTLCYDDQLRQALIDNLLYASSVANGKALVLLTLRTDYYGKCALYPKLAAALSDHQVLIGPMTKDELQHAIERPALLTGCEFETGLVEVLLHAVQGQPGGLPLLQHALLELWQQREGRQLTHKAYKAIGGVEGALERRAEKIYNQLSELEKQMCRRVFLRLTQPGEGAEDTKRRVSVQELVPLEGEKEMVDKVIQKLASAEARLIITEGESKLDGEQFIEVAHEALIRGWSRLREWIEVDRAAMRTHRKLTEAANEWYKKGKDESFLYRGARLAEAEEWEETHNEDLNELELTFLQASVKLRDKELSVAETQRKHELETAQRLAKEAEARRRAEAERAIEAEKREQEQIETAVILRKRAFMLAGVVVIATALAIIAVVFLGKAKRAREIAEYQSQIAHAREVLAFAEAKVNVNIECSLTLALHAYNLACDVPKIDLLPFGNTLRRVLAQSHVRTTIGGFSNPVSSIELTPDGKKIIACEDTIISIWDTISGNMTGGLPVKSAIRVDLDPNGQLLAIGLANRTVKIWDFKSNEFLKTFQLPKLGLIRLESAPTQYDLAWSPDGKKLATVFTSKVAQIWHVKENKYVSLVGHQDEVSGLAWSPDGKLLGTSSRDRTVRLWNTFSGESVKTLNGHNANVITVSWSPDGRWLASGCDDGLIYLWDMQTFKREALLSGHTNQVMMLNWNSGGQLFASASWDGTIRIWDVQTRRTITKLTGHTTGINNIIWSRDGRILASASKDRTVRIWDVDQTKTPVLIHKAEGWMWDASWSPDGRFMASASDDGIIRLYNYDNGLTRNLIGHLNQVTKVTWKPDGKQLASASADRSIRLWDPNTGEQQKIFMGHTGIIYGLDWSPDGKKLVSASPWDLSIILWDIETGERILTLYGIFSSSVAWSPDGRLIAFATGGEGTVHLWETNGKETDTFDTIKLIGHTSGSIFGLEWSPTGEFLASASDDNTVRIWEIRTGDCILTLTGHTSDVKDVAWSMDGKKLATASLDNTIRLWNVKTGKEISVLPGHTSGVRSVSWHPDGRQVISAAEDGTVRLFLTHIEDILQIAQKQNTRGLTAEERKCCLERSTLEMPH